MKYNKFSNKVIQIFIYVYVTVKLIFLLYTRYSYEIFLED